MPKSDKDPTSDVASAAAAPSTGFDTATSDASGGLFNQMVVAPNSGVGNDQQVAEYDDTASRAVSTGGWTDTPDFDQNEVGFPRLRLAQGLSPEVADGLAKMGQWLFTGYDPMDTVTIVPVMFSRTRSKRQDPTNRDSDIACESGDARVGFGDPGGDCKACPFAKWGSDPKTGRRVPPACQISYHYAAYIANVDSVGEVIFTRTSESAAQLVNNAVVRYGMGNFAFKVTSVPKQGPGGRRWAEPSLRMVPITPEMRDGLFRFGFAPRGSAAPAPAIATVSNGASA